MLGMRLVGTCARCRNPYGFTSGEFQRRPPARPCPSSALEIAHDVLRLAPASAAAESGEREARAMLLRPTGWLGLGCGLGFRG